VKGNSGVMISVKVAQGLSSYSIVRASMFVGLHHRDTRGAMTINIIMPINSKEVSKWSKWSTSSVIADGP
jgi:hypothetical protein